jgi:ATP adenylyltransferase
LNYIWTPWRMKYIQERRDEADCVFCLAAEAPDGVENLVFHRGEAVFMILNRYPYTSGHLMCVPLKHVDRLQDLPQDARVELIDMVSKAVEVLSSVYHPQGFNIGLNLGEVAGAGIADHLHMHIVPRWGGDTNFMSAVGQTRVLPESLLETYRRVKEAWEGLS